MNGVAGNFDGDIHLAKPTADYIYLQDDLTLNGSGQDLFFKKGWIVSTEAALLTVGNNRNVYNANDSSFVHGVLAKAGNNAFEFPIGKDSVLAAITIQTPNSGYVYTAEYFKVDPDAAGYPVDQRDVSLNSISRCEYWTMTRTGGSSAEYVGLSWDNPRSCEINSETDLVVTAWDGANWTDLGGTGHSGDSNSGSMLSASQTTDFIAFTIGSTNINNPLPIDLVEFKASPADHHVDLFWTTATETDNSHFSIQRSQDGVDWTLLEEIPGAGTSLISIDYNFRDNDPLAGVSYYRLKQTDHNGDFSFSRVESVLMQSDINISVYPNPASGMTTIAGQDIDLMGIELFNATGQLIPVQITRTPNKAIVALNNLPDGVYFLSVAHGDTRTTERLIVK